MAIWMGRSRPTKHSLKPKYGNRAKKKKGMEIVQAVPVRPVVVFSAWRSPRSDHHHRPPPPPSSRSPEITPFSGDPAYADLSKGWLPTSKPQLAPPTPESVTLLNLAHPPLEPAPLGFWPDGSAPELPGAAPSRRDHTGGYGAVHTARRGLLP